MDAVKGRMPENCLYIAVPSHPCDHGIPYILYIKKPVNKVTGFK